MGLEKTVILFVVSSLVQRSHQARTRNYARKTSLGAKLSESASSSDGMPSMTTHSESSLFEDVQEQSLKAESNLSTLKVRWVMGSKGQNCNDACGSVGLSCSSGSLGSLGSENDKKEALLSAGVDCTSFNAWDYGQGVSQCSDSGCCGGQCVGACSLPALKQCDAPAISSHQRLCACRASDFLQCAKSVDRQLKASFPNRWYPGANPNEGSPWGDYRIYPNWAWEPVLEAVPGCNGLSSGVKEFKFLVALDASWVKHYQQHQNHFRTQGYSSLGDSPRMIFDHVSYLFEKQFGIRVSVSRVFDFPNLQLGCDKTGGNCENPNDANTLTKTFLNQKGVSKRGNEAGIIRLGVGMGSTYCSSYAGLGGICYDGIAAIQQPVFLDNGSVLYGPMKTLAHEIAHLFGICSGSDCTNHHTRNDIPDLMVWDGRPARSDVRPEGLFYKFLTTCSTEYEETLCRKARDASCGA